MKYILILFLIAPQLIVAQNKELSLFDAIIGSQTYLSPETIEETSWRNNTEFTYLKNNSLKIWDVKSKKVKGLIGLSELKSITGIELTEFPEYKWINNNEVLIENGREIYLFNPFSKSIVSKVTLTEDAANAEFCKANDGFAYTVGDNLFITNSQGEHVPVTDDGGDGIVNGQYVHRHEFGTDDGIIWSPKGNFLAFYRKDESMVADYPLVDYMGRVAELKNIKYPMAGMTSEQVKIGIYNLAKKQTVFLKTGEPLDHYLTSIAWSPDEKSIYVAELNREQNHMKLNQYNALTGNLIQTLFEEKNEKYVEPLYPIQFSKVDTTVFYYLSRKDGWFHVYKYNTKGEMLKQITSGEWEVTKLLGFDEKEKYLFVEATKDSPLERHIYKVDVKNGKIDKLTKGEGIHEAYFNPSMTQFVDNWEGTDVPGKVDLISSDDKYIENIITSDDPLKGYIIGSNEIVTIKAADDRTDLFGRLIKPSHFDPSKKYPVIIYVYGGPHLQLVDRAWHNSVRWWQYYMAEKGYLMFTLDNRGSAYRGIEFENAIYRNFGIAEGADQMKGVEYLKSLPYIDQERIGVHGWSYGGFMTLNLKLKYPEIFKVGVAGGPVVDWSLYEIMYGERYMDTPEENPEGYLNANMINHVGTLDGKLMLIHGAQDETVVMQNSMKFLRECIDLGKQVDFFVYPTHPHNVRNIDRVHLMEKVSNYFLENL